MPIDWGTLRRHADDQADLLTRRQCLGAGMSDEALQWRVASRRWVRLHPGIYLTRPGRDDWHAHAMAALLYAASGADVADAAFRGRSAAYLWGLELRPPALIELAVPARRVVTAPRGVRIRRSTRWDDLVHDRAYPWRTTLPATVLDVAGEADPRLRCPSWLVPCRRSS